MNRKPVLLVVITAVIIIGALAVVLVNGNYFGGNHASTGSGLNCNAFSKITKVGGNASSNPEDSNVTFLIVEADTGPFEGMNGSAYHLEVPWPVINVHQNQTVVIHIFNCASSEQHGLAITHYFNEGVILQPDQSYTWTFVADQKGTFAMFCNTFCAIHPYMQNGRIIVS